MIDIKHLALLAAMVASVVLVVIIILARQIPRAQRAALTIFFMAGFVWATFLLLFLGSNNHDSAIRFAQVYYIAALVIAYCCVWLSILITGLIKWITSIALALLLVMSTIIMVNSGFIIASVQLEFNANAIILSKIGYYIYVGCFILYCVGAVGIFVKYLNMNISILERIRSKYILAAFVLAGVFGSLFNLVLPVFGNYRFIWVGPLNILIFSAIMFMAIIKHRLFNLRLYAVRFLLFVVGSLVLLAVYAVALGVLYNTYDAQHMIIQLNIVITIVFLALAYTFYYGIITLTERKFGSGLLKYGLLYELSYSMLVNTDLHRMLNAVSKVFSKNMRRSRAVFVYKNDDDNELYATDQREMMWKKTISDVSKYMNRNDVDIIISDEISADSTLRQWLLDENIAVIIKPESPRNSTKADIFVVIERTPLRIYSNKEISILTTIAQMIRVATDNAIHLRQIIDLNKSLNDKIADATADLRATNRKLKKLDAVKDDFISIVSHQLRTPLTSIKGYISMLLDGDFGKLTDEQRRVLNEAYSNSERMAFLISDFLDVSRLQTGKLELRKVPTKLDELLGIEIQQLRISTATRQIELEYEPPSNLPEIDCDPHKIIQVMANMIDNAIYYSHSGGKITVSLYEQHGRIIFVVKDQGIGVPRAEQHRLFTKFYRASNAHKIRPDGSGVGLYVARKVITAHGGSLIFESTEDVGSTFGFRLPIKQ